MGRVAIVTESSSNIPEELIERYRIHVLPLRVIWGTESYRDGVDITPQEFYARLRSDNFMPTTSSITPGELLDALNALAKDADAVIAILLSNELSSSVEAAKAVQQIAPEKPLHIVDSQTAAMAQGFVVIEAARAAEDGASVEQVIGRAESIIDRVHLYGVLETLKYLHRGGRIGSASLFMGSMLQLKPIVGILPRSGRAVGIAKPRTWKHASAKILDLVEAKVGDKPVHVAVSHGDREEAAQKIAEELKRRMDVRELFITYFTPVMGAHAGPVLAISFYTDDA